MIFKKTCRGWGGAADTPGNLFMAGTWIKERNKKKKNQQRQKEIKLGGFDRLVKHIGTSAID